MVDHAQQQSRASIESDHHCITKITKIDQSQCETTKMHLGQVQGLSDRVVSCNHHLKLCLRQLGESTEELDVMQTAWHAVKGLIVKQQQTQRA